jgi:hypothetical protein
LKSKRFRLWRSTASECEDNGGGGETQGTLTTPPPQLRVKVFC